MKKKSLARRKDVTLLKFSWIRNQFSCLSLYYVNNTENYNNEIKATGFFLKGKNLNQVFSDV
jgi:hypothetical protein